MSERLVDAFCQMVKIDSESGNEKTFLNYLADLFRNYLGAVCVFDAFGNLIARVTAKNCSGKPTILFVCHGDTVKPGMGIEPVVVGGVIRSEGDTILGADDKAGIAELYEAVFTADHHPELEIGITREEETAIKEGWVDSETTCNVGIIEGGRIRNGVPEKVFIKAECRSLNHTIPA